MTAPTDHQVEAAARALSTFDLGDDTQHPWLHTWDDLSIDIQANYRERARAALVAADGTRGVSQ